MNSLTELNIHDINDVLGRNDNPTTQEFGKQDRAPPPPYHLETSRGEMKERVTAYDLQTHFGGRQLKDFGLLSKLGTGIFVFAPSNDIPTVGELVNRQRGKRKQNGQRASVPLEVVDMDIGYGDDTSIGGNKYVLVLVDQCTSNSFIYGMKGSSGSDVCEALWKFLLTLVVSLKLSNVILIPV